VPCPHRASGAQYPQPPADLLATLALVIALPLAAGPAMRSFDPFSGREQPLVRVLGTVSLLVLLWEVASELQVRGSDVRVVIALLLYLAGGTGLGWLLAIRVPSGRRIAIVLPTAMRDFAVAAGIAATAFGPAAAAPLGIYGILVLVFGAAAVYAVRRRRGRHCQSNRLIRCPLSWLTPGLPHRPCSRQPEGAGAGHCSAKPIAPATRRRH
jgi:predicted Na+-dependent transporter